MKTTLLLLALSAMASLAPATPADAPSIQLAGLRASTPEPDTFVIVRMFQPSPKKVPWAAGMTLTEALDQAAPPDRPLPAKVTLHRGAKQQVYDLRSIRSGRKPNPKLEPNDEIHLGALYYPEAPATLLFLKP